MKLAVTDESGAPIVLGNLLGKGGEGAVYQIGSDASLVAKIYNDPPAIQRANKLRAMISARNTDISKFAAWPEALLLNGGKVRGFVMRRVEGKDIHELYSPKTRRTEFPTADFRFIIRAAANVARAFAAIHSKGCVIGDVNHGSVKISNAATATLIDCDSFQINSNGNTFFCEVGMGPFTPAEVQGKNLKTFVRTPNHDLFGLAILIFQLLMMGRHPFAGRYLGPGDMPIEKAISEHRFAYGLRQRQLLMQPPPHSVPVGALSSGIEQLFEGAFRMEAGNGFIRPSAEQWVQQLSALEGSLTRCREDAGHFHLSSLTKCPWCEVEKSLGVVLFGLYVGQSSVTGAFNLTAVWAAIEKIQPPPPAKALPPVDTTSFVEPPEFSEARTNILFRKIGSLAIVAIAVFLVLSPGVGIPGGWIFVAGLAAWACWPGKDSELRKKLQAAERTAAAADDAMDQRWEREAGPKTFFDKKTELADVKNKLTGLVKLKQDKLNQLNANREQIQRQRFLEQYLVERAKISGIGPGRKAQLTSFGISDAADVTKHQVMQVPGFGDALAEKMVAWRRGLEAKFRFNPALGVDRAELDKIEREIINLKQKYESQLAAGPKELEALRRRIESARERLWAERLRTYQDHARARHFLNKI